MPLQRLPTRREVLQAGVGAQNMVFVTADVHYTAAHHYDPARAAIGDFTPFWEFFFGHMAIDAETKTMTVSLRDLDGAVVYSMELAATG